VYTKITYISYIFTTKQIKLVTEISFFVFNFYH